MHLNSGLTDTETDNVTGETVKYTYGDSGNITNIADSDGILTTYAYDKANRLKREDIVSDNRSYIYVYDLYGNITKKQEYYYNGSLIKTNEYAYTNGRLTAFNNETISYDIMGNPETYRGYNLTWEKGKRLIAFGSNTFKYDGRGRRTKKNGVSYYYDYNDRLISSSDGMQYFYDHIGVAGFKYNNNLYYYKRDIQSNVIAILDSNGNTVVQYVYDAWGNHTVSGSNTALGNLNPFRYRSYFYDTETKLYYLKTRYYDPETGRFLNMDSVQYADPEAINGLNLYVYCGNNPVMGYDPEGTWNWKKFFGWVVTGLVAVASIAAVAVVACGVVASGGLLGSVLVGAGVGSLVGMSSSIVAQGGFANADPWKVAKAGGIGAAIGAVSGAASYGIGSIGSYIGESLGNALGNATHISSGITFGSIFNTSSLMAFGSLAGKIGGGLAGATAGNYFANKFFGNYLNGNETIQQGFESEFPMWLISFLRWI